MRQDGFKAPKTSVIHEFSYIYIYYTCTYLCVSMVGKNKQDNKINYIKYYQHSATNTQTKRYKIYTFNTKQD